MVYETYNYISNDEQEDQFFYKFYYLNKIFYNAKFMFPKIAFVVLRFSSISFVSLFKICCHEILLSHMIYAVLTNILFS